MKVPKARKLKSGTWFIYLRLGGDGVSVTGETEKECVHKAALVKSQYLVNRKPIKKQRRIASERTLSQAIDSYCNRRKNRSPSTIRGYRTIQNNYFQKYMDKPIRSIKDWQAVYDSEKDRLAPYTMKNAFGLLKSVYKEEIGHDMPDVIAIAPVRESRPFLDSAEIERFLKLIENQNCEIAALLALHSLRASEILDLTWDDIDFKNKRIRVFGAVVPDEKHQLVKKAANKNDTSRRYVPIFIPRLEELLKKYNGDDKPVCRYYVANGASKAINSICEDNGLQKVGLHGLRHSIASLMVLKNIPEPVLQAIGGWKDSTTVHKIYVHVSEKDIKDELGNLEQFFTNSQTNKSKPPETVGAQAV